MKVNRKTSLSPCSLSLAMISIAVHFQFIGYRQQHICLFCFSRYFPSEFSSFLTRFSLPWFTRMKALNKGEKKAKIKKLH
jgi:hypothetical protein